MIERNNTGFSAEVFIAISDAADHMSRHLREDPLYKQLKYQFCSASAGSPRSLSVLTDKIVPFRPISLHDDAGYFLLKSLLKNEADFSMDDFDRATYETELFVADDLGLTEP